MVILIQNIEAKINDVHTGTISNFGGISAEYGDGDYFKLTGIEGFINDLSNAIELVDYESPELFGLKNKTEFIQVICNL